MPGVHFPRVFVVFKQEVPEGHSLSLSGVHFPQVFVVFKQEVPEGHSLSLSGAHFPQVLFFKQVVPGPQSQIALEVDVVVEEVKVVGEEAMVDVELGEVVEGVIQSES